MKQTFVPGERDQRIVGCLFASSRLTGAGEESGTGGTAHIRASA
jgi:hypothetical protein